MIDTQVLAIPDVYQAVVTTPTARRDDSLRFYLVTYDCLQRGFATIWENLGVDFAVTFVDTEDNSFAISTPTTFSFNST